MCSLQRAQGFGVRPASCSAKKSAKTVSANDSDMSTTSKANPPMRATASASARALGPQHPWSTPSAKCTSFMWEPSTS